MANRYFVSGGNGNWNSTNNWSDTDGGSSGFSVPVAGDNVFLTATSGANTLSLTSATACASINCTGFTGTLTGAFQLTVSGNVILSASMTYSITGTLIINATASLTSAGKTVPLLQLNGNFTFTLTDNWNILGTLTWTASGGGTQTINGNTMYCYSFTAANGASRIITGTTNLVINAPTTGTINVTSALNNNITINAAGTITVTALLLYGGTFTTTTSNVVGTSLTTNGTVTLNIGNVYFSTININGPSIITLSSDLNCIGQMNIIVGSTVILGAYNLMFENSLNVLVGSVYFSSTGTYTLDKDIYVVNLQFGTAGNSPTINGSTIYASGNLTVLGSTSVVSGTTNIELNGSGTWVSTQTSTGNFRLNVTFNTSGTITISGSIYYRTGTITYLSGTIITTGSILNLRSSATLNTAGMTWNDVSVVLTTATITINSLLNISGTLLLGTIDIILSGTSGFICNTLSLSSTTFTVPRSLTLTSGLSYTTVNMTMLGPTDVFRYTIKSSTPSSQAILTCTGQNNVMYVNATDIDSSMGKTIFSFNGVLSNTLNWELLTPSIMTSGGNFVFHN